MGNLIDSVNTKNLILDMTTNQVSPADTSLVVVKSGTQVIPLMPNRSIKAFTSGGSGLYINSVFNKHTVNAHMGLSIDNIITEMIRTDSLTWVLDFSREGRNLCNYIEFSYINKDTQLYTTFNFNTNQTIFLYGTYLSMVIDSTAKTLTFTRNSLQFIKSSIDARISAIVLRMKFLVPIKMLVVEDEISDGVQETIDISSLSQDSQIDVTVDGSTVSYKAIPLDPKLIRMSSYEKFSSGFDRKLEDYYLDESGVIDSFKDSSKKATGNNLHTSYPRWNLLKEIDNSDIKSWSISGVDDVEENTVNDLYTDAGFNNLTFNINSYSGNTMQIILCNIVMLFPLSDVEEYTSLPATPTTIGTVNFYIKTNTSTYMLYSYKFSRDHKVGSIPHIPLLDDTESIKLKLNDTTEIDRDYNLVVGQTYNLYTTAPYSVLLKHNNRQVDTSIRVLNGTLPVISAQTKEVGGSEATFLGYYSSSTGGTQYINSSLEWVNNPTPGQTLYARWSQTLVFSLVTQPIYTGKKSIEADKNFVQDPATLSANDSLYYYTSPSGASGSLIGRTLKGTISLGANVSYQDLTTYNLSGGYQWYSYSNRLHIKANLLDTIATMTLNGATLLTVTDVPCSLTKDETDGYTPAKNVRYAVVANNGTFIVQAINDNSFSVEADYIVYDENGTQESTGTVTVPAGTSNIISYSRSSGSSYKLVITQSWDDTAGDNAGKDSIYETTIEFTEEEVPPPPQTDTPTVGTPYCGSDLGYNYLRVSVTNNDSKEVYIKTGGKITIGTLAGGETATLILNQGFDTPLSYNYSISATATDGSETISNGVTRSGTITFCTAM